MGFLYKTVDGTKKGIEGELLVYKLSTLGNPALDTLVESSVLLRETLLHNAKKVATANVITEGKIVRDDSGLKLLNAPGTAVGICLGNEVAGNVGFFVPKGRAAVDVGEKTIPANSYFVAAPGGVAAAYQETAVVLANALVSSATGDFTNTVWKAGGEVINVHTNADDATARGLAVTFYFVNALGALDTETIILNSVDSSVNVEGTKLCTALLAYILEDAITTATLHIEDEDGNACKTQATPLGSTSYGSVAMTTVDAKGQRVKLTCGAGNITGKILIVGKNGANQTLVDLVTFTNVNSAYSSVGFKEVDMLFVGDDRQATAAWSVGVDVNTPSQIVGKMLEEGVANSRALCEVLLAGNVQTITLMESYIDLKGSANTDSANNDQVALPTNGALVMAGKAVAAGAFDAGALTNPDVGRNVCIGIINDSGGALELFEGTSIFTVTGTFQGRAQVDTISLTSSAANKSVANNRYRYVYGTKPFDTVTGVEVDEVPADGLKISVGIGSKIAIQNDIFTVLKATKNGATFAFSSAIDYENNTVNLGATSDNDDFRIVYSIPLKS